MSFDSTLHSLAIRWKDAGVLLPGFSLIARGEPVEIADIAGAAGVPVDSVDKALEAARCERDEAGRLIDLYGMTLSPTLHRLEIESKIVYSCCALWAQVIPKLVDRIVKVESVDPNCRELVRLTISPRGVESVAPKGAVATMAVADQRAIDEDVGAAFCRNVRHCVSLDSAESFAAASPSRHIVDLAEFEKLADHFYQQIWGSSRVEA